MTGALLINAYNVMLSYSIGDERLCSDIDIVHPRHFESGRHVALPPFITPES